MNRKFAMAFSQHHPRYDTLLDSRDDTKSGIRRGLARVLQIANLSDFVRSPCFSLRKPPKLEVTAAEFLKEPSDLWSRHSPNKKFPV